MTKNERVLAFRAVLYGVLVYVAVKFGPFLVSTAVIRLSRANEFTIYLSTTAGNSVSVFAPLLGGMTAGYLMSKKGWWYGMITGVVASLVSFAVAAAIGIFFLHEFKASTEEVTKLIFLIVSQLITLVGFMTAGGVVGEYIRQQKSLKKSS